MKLSISNIAWTMEQDEQVYEMMKQYEFSGLEIAPTRIFVNAPYTMIKEATEWAEQLKQQHGFVVPSMQSIWYGREERLFGRPEERSVLLDYTKKAIDFATAINCKNLVFGCPRNRVLFDDSNPQIAVSFFKEIGEYAVYKGTVIGMEANPPIYNTNYINDTLSALELIAKVDSKGFLLNLDVGTMIQNKEDVKELHGNIKFINHVHVSEPGLKPIEKRQLHEDLKSILLEEEYCGFISIESGRQENMDLVEKQLKYVKELFG